MSEKEVIGKEYDLETLARMTTDELSKTKPTTLIIDTLKIPVSSWTDASAEFIKYLLGAGDLSHANFPFCPDQGTRKCYVNNMPQHPNAEDDGKFIKVANGVFVDTKWNAKTHAVKMQKSLEKLNIPKKYTIKIKF